MDPQGLRRRLWPAADVSAPAPAPAVLEATHRGHADWVTALALLPRGLMASASADRALRIWRASGGDGAPSPGEGEAAAGRLHTNACDGSGNWWPGRTLCATAALRRLPHCQAFPGLSP